MKVVELLKIGQNLLETLQKQCVKINDVRFIDMYEEYRAMREANNKTSYAAMVLSQKYNISERQFYYLVKRLEKDCNVVAP